jgi:ElaB/YqjD/DUF883 family membrane-anchored ribosome-binding protein
MIVERAARCQQIATELRQLAARLDQVNAEGSPRKTEAEQLRALADQVQNL